jgi:serine/threonine protein kinase
LALISGSRLGPYEVLSALDTGGMGEVYRARDTRLDRMVAVKMPAVLAANPQFRERFDREAVHRDIKPANVFLTAHATRRPHLTQGVERAG